MLRLSRKEGIMVYLNPSPNGKFVSFNAAKSLYNLAYGSINGEEWHCKICSFSKIYYLGQFYSKSKRSTNFEKKACSAFSKLTRRTLNYSTINIKQLKHATLNKYCTSWCPYMSEWSQFDGYYLNSKTFLK